jgi:ubiquinone/menaquinone biosynthesis C-methylase UbiE
MNSEQSQEQWYKEYYARVGSNRNDLRGNLGVLFQMLAAEKAVALSLRRVMHAANFAKVLDVGCGGGGDLMHLFRMGYLPQNITGIDIQATRLDTARNLYPSINFLHGDAADTGLLDADFDLVFESTMFATLADNAMLLKLPK